MLLTIIFIEGTLQAADHGWIGSQRWRLVSFQFGAFWPGLLRTWEPNFAGQPAAMFVTYTFLHGGMGHLLGNALAIYALGPVVCDRAGQRGFGLIFGLSALGGAFCFAALSPGNTPMIGASGAIFGLAGAWLRWQWQDRSSGLEGVSKVLAIIALLIGLNIALYGWYDGGVAWQTHLGGFIVGIITGGLIKHQTQR